MKQLLTTFLLGFLTTLPCFAQVEDPLEKRPPTVILQTGIGMQWFGETYKLSTYSVERPVGRFWHLGLHGGYYFQNQPDFFDFHQNFLGGFEVGGFSKYFLHGRLSGHKSGFYIGPEIRVGQRRFQYSENNFFPPPPNPNYVKYQETSVKLLFRWGLQWQFGRAILEIFGPFGIEINQSNHDAYYYSNESLFVLLPSFQLGIAL